MPRPYKALRRQGYRRDLLLLQGTHTYYIGYDYSFQNIIVGYRGRGVPRRLQSLASARLSPPSCAFSLVTFYFQLPT